MHERDNLFFEEYKRLDRLCADLFSCREGVKEYLAQMEQAERQGRALVPSWTADFVSLDHVRWIRNQIAHSPAVLPISEEIDIAFIQAFYERILRVQDPLSLLRKEELAGQKLRAPRGGARKKTIRNSQRQSPPPAEGQKKALLFLIGIVILLLFILLYLVLRM